MLHVWQKNVCIYICIYVCVCVCVWTDVRTNDFIFSILAPICQGNFFMSTDRTWFCRENQQRVMPAWICRILAWRPETEMKVERTKVRWPVRSESWYDGQKSQLGERSQSARGLGAVKTMTSQSWYVGQRRQHGVGQSWPVD